eukprot:gene16026-24541_t
MKDLTEECSMLAAQLRSVRDRESETEDLKRQVTELRMHNQALSAWCERAGAGDATTGAVAVRPPDGVSAAECDDAAAVQGSLLLLKRDMSNLQAEADKRADDLQRERRDREEEAERAADFAREIADLRSAHDLLCGEADSLREENARLAAQAQAAGEKAEETLAENAELAEKVRALEEELRGLRQARDRLAQELDDEREHLSATQKVERERAREAETYKFETESLKAERARLEEQKKQTAAAHAEQCAELKTENARLRRETAELSIRCQQQAAARAKKNSEGELADIRSQNDALRKRVDHMAGTAQELTDRNADLENEVEALQAEIRELRAPDKAKDTGAWSLLSPDSPNTPSRKRLRDAMKAQSLADIRTVAGRDADRDAEVLRLRGEVSRLSALIVACGHAAPDIDLMDQKPVSPMQKSPTNPSSSGSSKGLSIPRVESVVTDSPPLGPTRSRTVPTMSAMMTHRQPSVDELKKQLELAETDASTLRMRYDAVVAEQKKQVDEQASTIIELKMSIATLKRETEVLKATQGKEAWEVDVERDKRIVDQMTLIEQLQAEASSKDEMHNNDLQKVAKEKQDLINSLQMRLDEVTDNFDAADKMRNKLLRENDRYHERANQLTERLAAMQQEIGEMQHHDGNAEK